MKKITLKSPDLDRIERAYLASLRVAILGVATLCLLGAIFFGANALWRVFVSTDVKENPVQVTGAQVAAELKRAAPTRTNANTDNQIPGAVRQSHAKWVRDVLPAFYAVYQTASQTYKKPEDETLTSEQLMNALGYDLQSYAENEAKAVVFIRDPNYQAQALAAVTAAIKDPAVVSQLTEYKAAEKTARSCSTTYQSQQVWDSNSTVCSDWFYEPYGCQVTRSVPVERCIPAYPEGIVSPRVAFGRADGEFFRLWSEQSEQVSAEAQATRDGREATRAQIGPNLLLVLQILGAFLVVMFFFLVVAIERHLRATAQPTLGAIAPADDGGSREPDLPSAEAPPAPSVPSDDRPLVPRWERGRKKP